jgi:hypothetical protein
MKNADKPAFGHEEVMERVDGAAKRFRTHNGLTKREYIAAQIMATVVFNYTGPFSEAAEYSISAADALLKALER